MKKYWFYFLSFLFLTGGCGISENSLPLVIPHNYSTIHYGFSILQTSKDYQIGDEFFVAPSIKSAWGVARNLELSFKSFGLGIGAEVKAQAYQSETWSFAYGAEGGFSFPMVSLLVNNLIPLNEDFINLISGSFYYGAGKIQGGWLYDNVGVGVFLKAGYLGNTSLFSDMGTKDKSDYAQRFLLQPILSFFWRETPQSYAFLSLEVGMIIPLYLLYFSIGYGF